LTVGDGPDNRDVDDGVGCLELSAHIPPSANMTPLRISRANRRRPQSRLVPTATTAASTTITVTPHSLDPLGEADPPTCSVVGAIEDLVERGGVRLPHQQAEQVLLK